MLLLFRPEKTSYSIGSNNEYGYKWNDLQKYLQHLITDNTAISKLRFYAIHNFTHCKKQNRKTQKLLTLFRHRERDMWNDIQKHQYASIQDSEDRRNKEEDSFQRMQQEVSQHSLSSATIHLYNMQLTHCHQIKLALTEYQGYSSSSNVNEHNCFDSYKCKYPSLTLLPNTVQSVRQYIKDSNSYTLLDDSSNNAIINTITDSSQPHSQHLHQQQPTTSTPLSDMLNEKQKEVFNIFQLFLNSTEEDDIVVPYLLLLGGPGTGKSFVVKCLQEYYESSRHASSKGVIVTCANYGFPAVLIGGQTIFSLLKLNAKMIIETEVEIRQLTPEEIYSKKSALEHMKILVIDEISTVPPSLLYAIDVRLRQIFSDERRFAGVAVLALGDLMQLGPVFGSNLAVSCVEYATNMQQGAVKLRDEKYRPESIWTKGTVLFSQITVLNLIQQQRAIHDHFHTDVINNLHKGNKFQQQDLKCYKLLSKEDMTEQGGFRFATILVSSNRERVDISYSQLKHYALIHNIPIVKWESKYQKWKNSPEDIPKAIKNDCAFFEYFCVGLQGFLCNNISNSLKLANGTPVELRSVQFNDAEIQRRFNDVYKITKPGQEILLQSPPDFLTYMPYPNDDKFHREWISSHSPTLDKDNNHALLLLDHNSQYDKYKSYPIQGAPCEGPSCVEICSHFPFQMGFAKTIHKAEGCTLDKVILSLTTVKKFIKFSHIFVAFSRVTNHDHIRLLLPISTTHDLISYITTLRQDPKILAYLKCIEENKQFNAEWIATYISKNKKKRFATRKLKQNCG